MYYWFKSAEFWKQADALKAQTDMADFLSVRDIHSLELRLPPLSEQRAIAEVLGALDDKIAANDRILSLSDDLVRNLMARLRGETRPIGDFAENVREPTDPSTLDGETAYFGLEHLPRRRLWAAAHGTAAGVTSGKSGFDRGDVLFGKLRPYFHKVVWATNPGICSTDILVVRAIDPRLAGFVLGQVASDAVVQECSASSRGTRMPRTSWKDLSAIAVAWPGEAEALNVSAQVLDLAAHAGGLVDESRTLAQTRDQLLPLLMSGKLRVKDAEAVVGDAV